MRHSAEQRPLQVGNKYGTIGKERQPVEQGVRKMYSRYNRKENILLLVLEISILIRKHVEFLCYLLALSFRIKIVVSRIPFRSPSLL